MSADDPVAQLNSLLARKARHHQMVCYEGPDHLWAVECQVCTEKREGHPNYLGKRTWPAPYGEEMAARIALDHLSGLGFVPNRLATPGPQGQARSTW